MEEYFLYSGAIFFKKQEGLGPAGTAAQNEISKP